MKVNGKHLSSNEYLENALEVRTTSGHSTRIEERNRIRKSIKSLFIKRSCFTLVRPAVNEDDLRNAENLTNEMLRPAFINEMDIIRNQLLNDIAPKMMFGEHLDGPKFCHLINVSQSFILSLILDILYHIGLY